MYYLFILILAVIVSFSMSVLPETILISDVDWKL